MYKSSEIKKKNQNKSIHPSNFPILFIKIPIIRPPSPKILRISSLVKRELFPVLYDIFNIYLVDRLKSLYMLYLQSTYHMRYTVTATNIMKADPTDIMAYIQKLTLLSSVREKYLYKY